MSLDRRPARRLPSTGTATPRDIAEAVNNIFAGRLDAVGEVTLTHGTTTTAVTDIRCTKNSCVILSPITANGAAEIGAGGMYISTYGDGTFTITHANNAQTDRTFRYVVLT